MTTKGNKLMNLASMSYISEDYWVAIVRLPWKKMIYVGEKGTAEMLIYKILQNKSNSKGGKGNGNYKNSGVAS